MHCATKVGKSCAWLASGDNSSAQISIVECVTPSPLILECFKVSLLLLALLLFIVVYLFVVVGTIADLAVL